ncbi:unnamed protein product, partial [Scytosiphon promiscuus]
EGKEGKGAGEWEELCAGESGQEDGATLPAAMGGAEGSGQEYPECDRRLADRGTRQGQQLHHPLFHPARDLPPLSPPPTPAATITPAETGVVATLVTTAMGGTHPSAC